MARVTQLTRSTYAAFVAGRRFAAVLFDAPAWDTAYHVVTAARFDAAADALDVRGVASGFVDVDGPGEVQLCREIPVGNVPLVAYYRDGVLVAGLIGIHQDIVARMTAVIDGRPIGRGDGWGGSPPAC